LATTWLFDLAFGHNTAFGPAFGHNMAFSSAFGHNMAFGLAFGHNAAFGPAFSHNKMLIGSVVKTNGPKIQTQLIVKLSLATNSDETQVQEVGYHYSKIFLIFALVTEHFVGEYLINLLKCLVLAAMISPIILVLLAASATMALPAS
jgi:hypothetical protein